MRLLSSVLGFALKKLGLLVALVLSLFLAFLLYKFVIPTVRAAEATRDQLLQLESDIKTLEQSLDELTNKAAEAQSKTDASLRGRIADKNRDLDAALEREDDLCGIVTKTIDALTPANKCKLAQEAVQGLSQAVETLEQGLAQTEDVQSAFPELSGRSNRGLVRPNAAPVGRGPATTAMD